MILLASRDDQFNLTIIEKIEDMGIDEIRALKEAAKYPKPQKTYTIPKVSAKRKQAQDEIDKQIKAAKDDWFDYVATIIKPSPYCWNCGEFISENYYRHASAHIFPKAIFESVATHPFNFLVLGAGCGCHNEFDSNIENAAKMQVWAKAVERFKMFEAQIKEKHKYLELFKSKIK